MVHGTVRSLWRLVFRSDDARLSVTGWWGIVGGGYVIGSLAGGVASSGFGGRGLLNSRRHALTDQLECDQDQRRKDHEMDESLFHE
jgi:hypothetical protein